MPLATVSLPAKYPPLCNAPVVDYLPNEKYRGLTAESAKKINVPIVGTTYETKVKVKASAVASGPGGQVCACLVRRSMRVY